MNIITSFKRRIFSYLLEVNFKIQLGDFKVPLPLGHAHTVTEVISTFGYLAL